MQGGFGVMLIVSHPRKVLDMYVGLILSMAEACCILGHSNPVLSSVWFSERRLDLYLWLKAEAGVHMTEGYLKPFSLPWMTLGDRVLLSNLVWPHTCDPAATHMLGLQTIMPCSKVNWWQMGQHGNDTVARTDNSQCVPEQYLAPSRKDLKEENKRGKPRLDL